MAILDPFGYGTHEVLNQAPAMVDYDAYSHDPALGKILSVFNAEWAAPHASAVGKRVGSARVQELARQANRNLPELRTHDRWGRRIDQIEFHPAWHELMTLAMRDEFHSLCWTKPQPGGQVARAAVSFLWNQGENGICCPLGMTYSAIPILRRDPARWAEFGKLVMSTDYDGRPLPAAQKRGGTVGMAMTEKQGGSDLRQTQTTATKNSDGTYSLVGHKWFFSVPHSDVFLTLARTEEGVSCFVVAGWLPDGSRNRLQIQRLKDKCGNKSNASSEVEFFDLYATMLGEEGRGIRTIIEMAHNTRLDFAVGSSGLMRQAVSQAIHHTTNRRAFQRSLIDLPIMRNVVADLAIEAEAMMWMSMRLAAAFDREHSDRAESLLSRVCTPVAKYWACKRAPQFVVEALECHGGNGFIGDHLMERLYREAPLNGIWEGTGNVICLDVLRSMRREPDTVATFLDEVRKAKGADARLDAFTDKIERRMTKLSELEPVARRVVEVMAFALQGSLLVRHSTSAVADAFCATRLDGDWGRAFGTMPMGLDTQAIVDRARIAIG
jgi:putative acyl-CoA dehydrogenase